MTKHYKNFNINNNIKVKLTKAGKARYQSILDNLNLGDTEFVDCDGYTQLDILSIFSMFKDLLGTSKTPFHDDILIEIEDERNE